LNLLITGGTGSFGKEFLRYILKTDISKVIVFSRDELKQWEMQKEFKDERIRYFIGCIRDKERLERAFEGVDWIVHAAALKQVPAMEYNPIEAVKTNIKGTENIINVALDRGVKRVLMLSTDKAVNPVNLYGATKLCAEKLMIAANQFGGTRRTHFSVVRYGNVLDSRGSVRPLFREQSKTGTLTLTDERMTRFFISLEDAVRFVADCLGSMQGGEVFIPKMKSYSIAEMAKEICPSCEIRYIGIRPGEKIHEILISKDESLNVAEFDDHFVITRERQRSEPFEYTSCK
jgi:UDP-N-acetylglucosamine 4,6-dehydratase